MRLKFLQFPEFVDGHAVGLKRGRPQPVSQGIEREIFPDGPAKPLSGSGHRLNLAHLRHTVAVEVAPDEQQLLAIDGGEPLAEIVAAIHIAPCGQGADGGHGECHTATFFVHGSDRIVLEPHEIPPVAKIDRPIRRRCAGEAPRVVVAVHETFELPVPGGPVDAKQHAVVGEARTVAFVEPAAAPVLRRTKEPTVGRAIGGEPHDPFGLV